MTTLAQSDHHYLVARPFLSSNFLRRNSADQQQQCLSTEYWDVSADCNMKRSNTAQLLKRMTRDGYFAEHTPYYPIPSPLLLHLLPDDHTMLRSRTGRNSTSAQTSRTAAGLMTRTCKRGFLPFLPLMLLQCYAVNTGLIPDDMSNIRDQAQYYRDNISPDLLCIP